jgi:hypothetical protein
MRTAIIGLLVAVLSLIVVTVARGQEPGATVVTHHETIPNPVFGSTFRVSESCKNVPCPCAWESPTTWTAGVIPDANTQVIIDGNVRIYSPEAQALSVGVYPGGLLSVAPFLKTHLQTTEVMVFEGGDFQMGTAQEPVIASAGITLRNLPFAANDPGQHLRGIIVVNGGISIHGKPLTDTFIRLVGEVAIGATTLSLSSSATDAGWKVGDTIVVPKSTQCASPSGTGTNCTDQTEERTLADISTDGLTLTLNEPLIFFHPGGRASDNTITFLPHVLNKSRTVTIRSESPDGVRGHVFLHGRTNADIRYASFEKMGRTDIRNLGPTNQKGRYPLHAHHLIGPTTPQANGRQFTFVGNVVDFGDENNTQDRKWGIAIHGSHFGLIEQNIVDRASGAGMVTEDASETGNLFKKNFVVRIVGGNGARVEDRDPGDKSKLGRAGVSYWLNGGGNNIFEDNIAAAVNECTYCYGFKFDNIGVSTSLKIPAFQGADPYATDGATIVNGFTIGLTQFARNESYAVPNGLTIWHYCTDLEDPVAPCSNEIKDFRLWHHHRWGFFGYQTDNSIVDGWISRNKTGVGTVLARSSLYLGDYMTRRMTIRNADIQGADVCLHTPANRDMRDVGGSDVGWFTIENSFLSCKTNIFNRPPFSTGGSGGLAPQTLTIRSVTFSHPIGQVGPNLTSILQGTNENRWLKNDVQVFSSPTFGGAGDLYLMPDYQGPEWCDNGLADCIQDVTITLGAKISKMRAYPLWAVPGPPSWTTPPTAPSEVGVAVD